ncbi:MAG: hypothetical protein QOF14_3716 [Hyphomicrobiales bacterium]|jgi:hypothetical protein|nr:hypothetical protein [Hyphomicrobiales bacterium]
MQGFDKYSGYLALFTALLAVGGALETFTNLGLLAKLFVIAIASLSVSLYCASVLAARIKPDPAIVGFGATAGPLSKKRIVLAILGLAIVAGIGIGLAIFVTVRFAARFDERVSTDTSVVTLTAAYAKIERITVQLPAQRQSACTWVDTSTRRSERLDLQMIDFSSATPKLQIDNFYYPQGLEIRCKPPGVVRANVQPASAAFYHSEDISSLRLWIMFMGGVIWLVACIRLAQLLRQ